MARDLAIDLGTANTLVYERSRGIVLNEPSVIALNSRTGDVLAMGHEAWQMIGRTPGYIVAVRPLRGGAITDFDITQRMIRLLLQRVGVNRFNRPRVVICVPSAITEVERRAVTEAARRAGAADAQLIEQPMAAAIGAGLPIHEPVGNMVIDVGGGTSETALISLGGLVALQAVRVGSFDIDNAVQTYVRREYGIAVGERTAEEIKVAIGSAYPTLDEFKAEVRGRDLMSGLPKTVILSPEEVREAIDEQVVAVIDSVIACLGQAPPELAQDLIVRGMYLVGGGGMLRGFDMRIAEETEIPVHLVDAPLECVVLGAGKVIENYDRLKMMFMGARRSGWERAGGTRSASARSRNLSQLLGQLGTATRSSAGEVTTSIWSRSVSHARLRTWSSSSGSKRLSTTTTRWPSRAATESRTELMVPRPASATSTTRSGPSASHTSAESPSNAIGDHGPPTVSTQRTAGSGDGHCSSAIRSPRANGSRPSTAAAMGGAIATPYQR